MPFFIHALKFALCARLSLAAVPTVKLADGRDMPVISMGTGGLKDPEASVTTALQVGFSSVDSALDYGNQEAVGRALSQFPRTSYWLTSKVPGCLGSLSVLPPFCGKNTAKAVDDNLQRLNVTYLDLLLLHFPPATSLLDNCGGLSCVMMREQWKALEDAKAAGKAKSIGVSNYCPKCLACLKSTASELPVVNQVEFHVGEGKDAQGFKSACEAENITLQAYSALGPWFGGSKSELISGNLTTGIAAKHRKSSVQVALRWLSQRRVPLVTKSTKREHLIADLDIFDWDLDADDLSKLDSATKPSASRNSPSFMCKANDVLGSIAV